MKRYLFLLALGAACGSGSHQYDDDDDASGAHAGQAGKGGHAGVASTSGGAGGANAQGGSGALSGNGATSGQGTETNGGTGAAGGARGGTGGAVGRAGDTSQAGAGEGGLSGDSGAGNSDGGIPATGGSSGSALTGGASGGGGTSATGGAAGTGGTAGHGGSSGGAAGSSGGLGGKTGIGGFIDNGGFGGVTDGSSLPMVELLVDGSSTMFQDGSYTQVFDSLVSRGVLASFEGKLDLGLTIFQGTATVTNESDPACAVLTNVAFAGDNGGEVGKSLANVGNAYSVGTKYETPTDFGILSAVNRLINVTVSSSVKKYIVLVINGEPNTCMVKDPQCGQDAAIAMVQEAHDLGIRTLVVGLGTILGTTDDGCEPVLSRCHADHLQDLANAGVGSPVEPPSKYSYVQACVADTGGSLVSTYATAGGGGSAHYYASGDPSDLTGEFTDVFQAIVDGTVP